MRNNLVRGGEYPVFSPNVEGVDYYETHGDSMEWWVGEFLGQYFDFEKEIVNAVIGADKYWPGDGGGPYWDEHTNYEERPRYQMEYLARWQATLDDLKHGRRFFSPSAESLFLELFKDVERLRTSSSRQPVVRTLRSGTKLYRARVCSEGVLEELLDDPLRHGGPPPPQHARPGRMNAEGITVLYSARDAQTAVSEMRPSIANEIAVVELQTTRPVRVLDFERLDDARDPRSLSYFQPDYAIETERREFLKGLHRSIAQPIVPGHEADYLITQTMAEYLAHVHKRPFDGVLFKSVQRSRGTNVVLFPQRGLISDSMSDLFGVALASDAPRVFQVNAVKYSNIELQVSRGSDGALHKYAKFDQGNDDF